MSRWLATMGGTYGPWLDGFAGGPFDGRELLVCIAAIVAALAYVRGLTRS